jgi:hypothetical protein
MVQKNSKVNGSVDLNEIYIGCVEHTHVCVRKDLFSLIVLSLYEEIFSILNVDNRYCIYISIDV